MFYLLTFDCVPKFKLFVFMIIQVLLHLQSHHFILLLTLKQILKEKKIIVNFFLLLSYMHEVSFAICEPSRRNHLSTIMMNILKKLILRWKKCYNQQFLYKNSILIEFDLLCKRFLPNSQHPSTLIWIYFIFFY
jgi:hypothetical protein